MNSYNTPTGISNDPNGDTDSDIGKTFIENAKAFTESCNSKLDFGQQEIPQQILYVPTFAKDSLTDIANNANQYNKEISGVLYGLRISSPQKGFESLVAAYPTLAMDMNAAQITRTQISLQLAKQNGAQLAQATGLESIYRKMGVDTSGDLLLEFHIHQDSLGETFRGKPSAGDYQQIEQLLLNGSLRDRESWNWAVFTLHNGILYKTITQSYKGTDGRIQHRVFEMIEEN